MLPSNLEGVTGGEIIFRLDRATSFLYLFLKAAIVILTKGLLHRGVGSIWYVNKYKGIEVSDVYVLANSTDDENNKHHHVIRKEELCKNHVVHFKAAYQWGMPDVEFLTVRLIVIAWHHCSDNRRPTGNTK